MNVMLTSSVLFSGYRSRHKPKGTTFRIVSGRGLLKSAPCDRILKALDSDWRKTHRDYISYYFGNDTVPHLETREGARGLLTTGASVCSVVRFGNPRGKGRFFHIFADVFRKADTDLLAPALKTFVAKHRLDGLRAVLVAGRAQGVPASQYVKDAVVKFCHDNRLPLSCLWGTPADHGLCAYSAPKLGGGSLFLGLGRFLVSKKTTVNPAHIQAKGTRLMDITAHPQDFDDVEVTPENWRTFFSDIHLQPGDRVFVGPHQVWPEARQKK
jgi:hypothetical protein